MSRQPVIIQVLPTGDHRTVRRWMMAIGFFASTFLTLALVLAARYIPDSQSLLIAGPVVLVLFVNVILLFRNSMIDRYSESLCFDGGHCYSVTTNGSTQDRYQVRLRYKGETVTLTKEQEKDLQTETVLAFQVLGRKDWKAIKQLSTWREMIPEAV